MKKKQGSTLEKLKGRAATDEVRAQFAIQTLRNLKTAIATQLDQALQPLRELGREAEAWRAEATALYDVLPEASIAEAEAYIKQNPPSSGAIAYLIFVTREQFKTESASVNAKKRHAGTARAKQFIQAEWERYRSGYDGNKSAFARDYALRVKREIGVDVTEKTIRDRWLT